MLPLAWIMVLLHSSVGLSLYVIPKFTKIKVHQKLLPPFKDEHLGRVWINWPTPIFSPLPRASHCVSYMVGCTCPVHLGTPTMMIGCTKDQVLGMSPIRVLLLASSGLTSKLPWNQVQALDPNHPHWFSIFKYIPYAPFPHDFTN